MRKKQINIEKILCPTKNILQINGEVITTLIVDAELDILECEFMNDSTVTINTEGLTYIQLTYNNLIELMDLIEKSDEMYKKILKDE